MNFNFWNAMIDIGFWTRLARKKIQQYKLQASIRPIIAKCRLSNRPDKISIITIDAFSFGDTPEEVKSGPVDFKFHGTFLNTNTLEEFKKFSEEEQEKRMIAKQQESICKLIQGEAVINITEIFLLTFGDLKKHIFMYQFYATAIPVQNYKIISSAPASEALSPDQLKGVNRHVKSFIDLGLPLPQLTVLKGLEQSSLKEFIAHPEECYLFCISDTTNFGNMTGYNTSTILSIFAHLRENKLVAPGHLSKVRFLLLKEFLVYNLQTDYSFQKSQVLELDLSEITVGPFENRLQHKKKVLELDLKAFMDERMLAKEAVDLNIKLMKWRLIPSLDISKIQTTRCLLFGAGTLGCQLARNLIGWGVKNITFIDYSKVSYSNPVRQSLYDYEDTLNGGKPKAQTAAEKLKKIYPEINAQGYSIPIPMPGHYVTKEDHIKQTFVNLDKIEELVKSHDALFLLLDSREARWLPTVLANKYDKACITVGLGFDSFVVVRHGITPSLHNSTEHGERLCCYFCNDVVTPQNTMKDRTLDQMCTVTKPGLSFISAAYAAELYISLLHHPLQHHAPGNEDSKSLPVTDLGKLPHHLRGNMSDFQTSIFYGRAFDQCVACSKYILDEYTRDRDDFMLKVLNDPAFIHVVVKLKEELEEYAKMESGIIEITDDYDYQSEANAMLPTETASTKSTQAASSQPAA